MTFLTLGMGYAYIRGLRRTHGKFSVALSPLLALTFVRVTIPTNAFVEEGTVTFRAERLLDENRRLKERS
jgi:hypothetical protein